MVGIRLQSNTLTLFINLFYTSEDFRLSYLWDDTAVHVNNGSPVFLARSVIQNFTWDFQNPGKTSSVRCVQCECSCIILENDSISNKVLQNQEVIYFICYSVQKNILFGNLKKNEKEKRMAIHLRIFWSESFIETFQYKLLYYFLCFWCIIYSNFSRNGAPSVCDGCLSKVPVQIVPFWPVPIPVIKLAILASKALQSDNENIQQQTGLSQCNLIEGSIEHHFKVSDPHSPSKLRSCFFCFFFY